MGLFEDFKIVLPPTVENKIMYWVHKADKEVSGLGDAYLDVERKLIIITDAFMLKQECTGADTELDDKSIASAMFKAHKDTQKGKARNIKFWWHSHVNMNVFWSGTDDIAMGKLGTHGWFSHIVFNKKHEKRGAISYPLLKSSCGIEEKTVEYDDEIIILSSQPISPEDVKKLDKEFDDNYSEKKFTSIADDPDDKWNNNQYSSRINKKGDFSGRYYDKSKDKKENRTRTSKDLYPVPSDDKVLFENKNTMIFFDERADLIMQRHNTIVYLEYQPERFPLSILNEVTDDCLQVLCDEVTSWKGQHADALRNELESEMLSRMDNEIDEQEDDEDDNNKSGNQKHLPGIVQ